MSKITFRADDALVDRLEALDASKSEVMREALRYYLDTAARDSTRERQTRTTDLSHTGSFDDLLADRIDQAVSDRVESAFAERAQQSPERAPPSEVSVSITLEGVTASDATVERETDAETTPRKTSSLNEAVTHTSEPETTEHACSQCGETVASDHVYCPNCGEKATHRLFCECGDELSSDWAFCPTCGRRTPAADVLDRP